jgi:hypothetical protein
MGRSENFRQYAADCVRQAAGEQTPEDKNILLNMALAWVRLAQQSQSAGATPGPADESGLPPAEASSGNAASPAA